MESFPCDASYYRTQGWIVRIRDYGTPVYAQMFTLYQGDIPVYEVRRLPYSRKSNGGIFPDEQCHIRLVNRTCYAPRCIDKLREFIIHNRLHYKGISRLDICNDFTKFDNNANPMNIIEKYMRAQISKINQSRVSAHGKDQFVGRVWNSLKWGAETSAVSTKLYDKSLEMSADGKAKLWIFDAWEQQQIAQVQWCIYIDDKGIERHKPVCVKYGTKEKHAIPLEQAQQVRVWRVEFSIKTEGKHMINADTGELIRIELSSIDTSEKLLYMFHVLARHYFHFKTIVKNSNGVIQRKDRCPDIPLFKYNNIDINFHPLRITNEKAPSRTYKIVARFLDDISKDYEHYDDNLRAAANRLYGKMLYEASRHQICKQTTTNEQDLQMEFEAMFGSYFNKDIYEMYLVKYQGDKIAAIENMRKNAVR